MWDPIKPAPPVTRTFKCAPSTRSTFQVPRAEREPAGPAPEGYREEAVVRAGIRVAAGLERVAGSHGGRGGDRSSRAGGLRSWSSRQDAPAINVAVRPGNSILASEQSSPGTSMSTLRLSTT